MNVDPKLISDTRIQLHWASQLISAAADATLEKAEDDSHSNLGWEPEHNQLVGRSGVSIDVSEFKLIHEKNSLPLKGKTLASANDWLSDLLGKALTFRDYEMPDHVVAKQAAFSPSYLHLESISAWLTFGQNALANQGTLRVWPHHFDLGFWNPGKIDGQSIGGGFSLGDNHYNQPYFYVNAYGVDRPDSLPDIPVGHWAEKWLGAILTADEMGMEKDKRSASVMTYLDAAVEICKELTGAHN